MCACYVGIYLLLDTCFSLSQDVLLIWQHIMHIHIVLIITYMCENGYVPFKLVFQFSLFVHVMLVSTYCLIHVLHILEMFVCYSNIPCT